MLFFFFSSRRRHTRYWRDWSSDVCSSDLVHRLAHHAGLPLPTRRSAGAAGYDVCSAEPDLVLQPLERRLIRTGLALAIQIGRASCRERVETLEDAERAKKERRRP